MPAERPRSWYPAGQLRIVAAGQLAPHKGFDLIVEAARQLLDMGLAAFDIDLVGAGLDDHYRRLIIERRVAGHVRLVGAVDREALGERLWEYDLFLFPTWEREPFAFAPLEAGARGCVPLITRDCGNAEWSVDGVEAIKIARDGTSIARAIARVLDRAIDLEQIGRRARAVTERFFTLDRAADAVEEAFRDAVAAPAHDPGGTADAYNLARLAERMALDWAQQVR
jgi:glycosyltransferase involved in cell wall biosynthesis